MMNKAAFWLILLASLPILGGRAVHLFLKPELTEPQAFYTLWPFWATGFALIAFGWLLELVTILRR